MLNAAAAARINGFTHLNLTKLDVLSDLEEIKVSVTFIDCLPDVARTLLTVTETGPWARQSCTPYLSSICRRETGST